MLQHLPMSSVSMLSQSYLRASYLSRALILRPQTPK